MHLTSPPARRVVWEDGMHLTPQHFQAQRRYHEDQVSRALAAVHPFAYGLASLVIDHDALHNGTFAVLSARGALPDGTVFHLPDADAVPAPVEVASRFSPTRDSHVVYLTLAPWRADSANLVDPVFGGDARFRVDEDVVVDESTGEDPVPVKFAARNFQVRFDDDLPDGHASLPIARISRDGRGQYQLDARYIPPTLHLSASDRLLALTRDIVSLVEAKGQGLAATLAQATATAAGGAAAYVGNELATRWLLHAVRSADAPLRHLLLSRRAHPEQLYSELARLSGALCTFSMTSHPRDVPLYDHDALTETFEALERALRIHLDVVISARALVMPLQQVSEVLHTALVSDPRCFEPDVRWFIAVRAQVGSAELIDRVQRLTKTCASKFVLELVRRAFNGLPTEHVPMPPSGLAPKPDLVYFELTMTGPCAQSLSESREIGVYVPDALPGAYVELALLLPS
ncbi:MAG: type VI secretion system baseplate subunit TssK [Gemmatimonadaceae bacterium]|nr:type VI secretion system baseplate subunit TssK [Gemmatimonadaceae bacterium]